jgi:hypothetical protein
MRIHRPVLCYVSGDTAYFTTSLLKNNGGMTGMIFHMNTMQEFHIPLVGIVRGGKECECEVCKRDWTGNKPNWKIIILKFDWDAQRPCEIANSINSPFSVKDINEKKVPWLKPSHWVEKGKNIYAGTPLEVFCEIILNSGGRVYREMTAEELNLGKIRKEVSIGKI